RGPSNCIRRSMPTSHSRPQHSWQAFIDSRAPERSVKNHVHLLRPRPIGNCNEVVQRKRRWHAPDDEVFEHLRRQIGEPHHAAHEPVGDLLGRGDILNGGSGTGFQLPPPVPGAGDGAQHMRVLRPAVPDCHLIGREDLRPPIAFADRQGDDDADGISRAGHAQASVWWAAIMSLRTELSPSWRRSTAMPSSPTVTRSTRSWTMRVCSAGYSAAQSWSNSPSAWTTAFSSTVGLSSRRAFMVRAATSGARIMRRISPTTASSTGLTP